MFRILTETVETTSKFKDWIVNNPVLFALTIVVGLLVIVELFVAYKRSQKRNRKYNQRNYRKY